MELETAKTKSILEWLRGHLIVVDPAAMEEMRQGVKNVVGRDEIHRAMHNDHKIQMEMLCVVHPLTEEEANQKMKLIYKHQSEFPSKLRVTIDQAYRDAQDPPDAWSFLARMYEATKTFFLGRNPNAIANNRNELQLDLSGEWLGLDSDIDTEDQAEIAIRFFPMILTEHLQLSYAILGPIQLLLSREIAVSFVPLLAKLLTEAGEFLERQAVVKVGLRNIFELLLTNSFPQLVVGGEISKSFDDESLLALSRLRELGFVENVEIGMLIMALLANSIEDQREIEFVETRFRLLIGWDPSILMDGGTSNRPLLHTIYSESMRSDVDACLFLRLFEVLSELGMTHYPEELGFIFHKWGGTYPLHRFASTHGPEEIVQTVNDNLVRTIGSNAKTLASLVAAATTNDKIHVDGLNRLLCLNPIASTSQAISISDREAV